MKGVFGRGRYANVTSTLALIVALGGTAYAANTVRSSDIVNGQVKSADIASKGVKNADLAGNAVTSAKVKDGSLLKKDFGANQLPAGPQGPKGDPGAAGTPGAAGAPGTPGTARAYAWVDTTTPSFDNAHTKGFTAVARNATGRYCLTPAAGIDPATTAAVVAPDWGGSSAATARALIRSSAVDCPAGQFEVRTFDGNTAANTVSFTIIVP
jgi:hypothetical protein